MSNTSYLPHADKEKLSWLMNFNTVFAGIAVILGFTAAEIAAINADYMAARYIIDTLEILKGEMLERTRYKDLLFHGEPGVPMGEMPVIADMPVAPSPVLAGIFKRVAKVVQRIKNHPNYNEAMGRNLGIIGAEKVVDLNTVKPLISVKAIADDSITLDFVKGSLDGVYVYAGTPVHIVPEGETTPEGGNSMEAEMSWEEIAKINHGPFVDRRRNQSGNFETRYYKMRYFKKDTLVGFDSDIIRVISPISKAGADLSNKVK
jgi:hypothetical protein